MAWPILLAAAAVGALVIVGIVVAVVLIAVRASKGKNVKRPRPDGVRRCVVCTSWRSRPC